MRIRMVFFVVCVIIIGSACSEEPTINVLDFKASQEFVDKHKISVKVRQASNTISFFYFEANALSEKLAAIGVLSSIKDRSEEVIIQTLNRNSCSFIVKIDLTKEQGFIFLEENEKGRDLVTVIKSSFFISN